MAKPHTFPTVIDGLATVTISFLRSRNYLSAPGHKAGLVEWTRNGRPAGSIAIEVIRAEASAELIMKYRSNGVYKEHRVPIVSRVSPFGGLIWLFVCPVTGFKCRNLYENGDLFTHRAALGKAMYYCQTISKPHRDLIKEFAEYRFQGLEYEFYKKYTKRMYRGKITRRYQSFLKKVGRI